MRSLLLTAFCFSITFGAAATTLPRLSVEQLNAKADVVAVVQIDSGSMIKSNERNCGVRYRGRVIEAIKGPFKSNEIIEFGPYAGIGVGSSMLVFLNTSTNVYSPKASTNSVSLAQESEFQEACAAAMPKYLVMFDGFGQLEISWTTKLNYQEAVSFKDEWVASPETLERRLREPGDNHIVSPEYWVKVDDVVAYLKKINARDAATP